MRQTITIEFINHMIYLKYKTWYWIFWRKIQSCVLKRKLLYRCYITEWVIQIVDFLCVFLVAILTSRWVQFVHQSIIHSPWVDDWLKDGFDGFNDRIDLIFQQSVLKLISYQFWLDFKRLWIEFEFICFLRSAKLQLKQNIDGIQRIQDKVNNKNWYSVLMAT